MEIEKDLIHICEKVASKLVLIPRGNETKNNKINLDTRLIFPSY